LQVAAAVVGAAAKVDQAVARAAVAPVALRSIQQQALQVETVEQILAAAVERQEHVRPYKLLATVDLV
jgi:hypothetical protein